MILSSSQDPACLFGAYKLTSNSKEYPRLKIEITAGIPIGVEAIESIFCVSTPATWRREDKTCDSHNTIE